MTNLIVCRGMTKRAAAEDGPSFEQQFGILANALVADKYPKLDRMKLAFQLIDKDEDNSKAVGACVYLLGKNVVFVPAFFKNSKIRTGDMMFLAQSQQFLPLSDPWLAWIQDKDLQESGEIVSKEIDENGLNGSPVTVREITDPIVKTACVYLKGLLRTKDPLEKMDQTSVLDTALKMGKTASAEMLTQLADNVDFLNSALHFYSGDEIDGFAKKASAMWDEPADEVQVILPFTKEARSLSDVELDALHRDGYLIKRAAETEPVTVIRRKAVPRSFSTVTKPGMYELLSMDGGVHRCLVMRKRSMDCCCCCGPVCMEAGERTYGDPGPAEPGLNPGTPAWSDADGSLVVFWSKETNKPSRLPKDAMTMNGDGVESFKASQLEGYGKAATPGSVPSISWDALLLCPDGCCYRMDRASKHDDCWYNYSADKCIVVSEDKAQKSPVVSKAMVIIPQGSRIVQPPEISPEDKPEDPNKGKHMFSIVTFSGLDSFIDAWSRKNFKNVKLTSDGGGDIQVDEGSEGRTMSVKEASLHLVRDLGIDPGVARTMICSVTDGNGHREHRTESFLVTKTAALDNGWEDSPMAASEVQNKGDQQEQIPMPNVYESPEKLQQAATIAAQNGIKEVFDVTALKMLVRQGNVLEEIHDDLPVMMKMLDSLCRKLFLLYWHTEEFEDRYGTVKLKSLEDSIKTTLDSLSELTIFFKMRNIDGNIGTGDDGGELMEGHDL